MNKKQIHGVTKESSCLAVGVVICKNCGQRKYLFHDVTDDYEQDILNINRKSNCCVNPYYIYDNEFKKKWVN